MKTFAGVGVFVQVRAVKVAQPVRVGREVRGHPVEQHANPGLVAARHKTRKTFRLAKTRRRRIEADGLITPRAVERVFAHWHQLQMGEAHVLRVGNELRGQFVPGEPARRGAGRIFRTPPRAGMHFVNAHGRVQRVGPLARLRHGRESGHGGHDAGRGRAQFGLARIRVGAHRQHPAIGGADFKLVFRAKLHAGQENFPHAALAPEPHRVAASIPEVEIAQHAHAGRARRPHGKAGAAHAVHHPLISAQNFVGPPVRPFGEQPDIGFAQHGAEAVGVFEQRLSAAAPLHLQPIGRRAVQRQQAFKKAVFVAQCQRGQRFATGRVHRQHPLRAGQKGAHRHAATFLCVRPEHRKRVAVAGAADQFNIVRVQHGVSRQDQNSAGSICQIWRAYSPIVRSDENAPIPATLAMARSHHWALWRYSAST